MHHRSKERRGCSPNQGLATSARDLLGNREESRWRILTAAPGDGPARLRGLPDTQACGHTSAHRQRGRGPGPRAPARAAPPSQDCLISSEINRAEGWGAPQIPQANTQVKQHHLPCKGLFKLTRRGRSRATKPALSSKANLCPRAPWGGNLWPPPRPLLPHFLCCWPTQERASPQSWRR